jgi:hypothetical protein
MKGENRTEGDGERAGGGEEEEKGGRWEEGR